MKKLSGKKATLVVNVASNDALTALEYLGLVNLQKDYEKEGLKVIAYPCNQFGGSEPGTNKEIKQRLKELDVNFTVMDKCEVNGDKANPAYEYLRDNSVLRGADIKGNFAKFLVNSKGDVVAYYRPSRRFETLIKDIDTLVEA